MVSQSLSCAIHQAHRRRTCHSRKHRNRYSERSPPGLLWSGIFGSGEVQSWLFPLSVSLVPAFRLTSAFPFRATTSGPLSGFTPQSYYLRAERQGQVCTPCSSVFRPYGTAKSAALGIVKQACLCSHWHDFSPAKRLSPLPHWSARRHFGGQCKT